jgi:hypothetical protein
MANPWEFLRDWTGENVNATAYDDEATAKGLAARCLSAAKEAGIGAAGVIKSAGGNLVSYFRGEQDSAADREFDRLTSGRD